MHSGEVTFIMPNNIVDNGGVSIVISTANSRISSLSFDSHIHGVRYVIVHQVYEDQTLDQIQYDLSYRDDVFYSRLDYPGLSKSRNVGLKSVSSKYAYIMDDDVKFDLKEIAHLIDWMEMNQVDVATGQFVFEDGLLSRNYNKNPFKHTIFSAANVSSIEICVNVESLRQKGILFDENFGLGTALPSGEEFIFITDCIESGLNVWFYPITTGVHPNITSGQDFFTSANKILAKREMFKRVFGWKAFIFIFAFWLKKARYVHKQGYFGLFTKIMLIGVK